jgi:ribosomal protein S6--L-glutamate ligase
MSKIKKALGNKLLIGRNEWCRLPDLDIPAIKAKIDTGAKTSAIHAFNIKPVMRESQKYVCFDIHPIQGNDTVLVNCHALVADERYIMSSNGHKEHRYVILTTLNMGEQCWNIELTLSNRDPLRFRMLLGREALNHRAVIDPSVVCNQTKMSSKTVLNLYRDSSFSSRMVK